jgi:hypothetical protein
MGVSYATADDVAVRWRPLSSEEYAQATVLAGDASALIRAEFPGVEGSVDADILTIVVAGMVKRAMAAPALGVTQEQETVGPYSHSQTFANPMGNVFLTGSERTLILGYKPSGGSFRYGNTTGGGLLSAQQLLNDYDGGVTVRP